MNIAHWQIEHAERFGAEIGVISGQLSLTNAELHERSCRLARALRELGLKAGDRVALALPNRVELYVAVGAVYHAGMVVVVLPDTADRELARMLRVCSASVLIAGSKTLRAVAAEAQVRLISDDPTEGDYCGLAGLIAAHPPLWSPAARAPGDAAQFCCTSGTSDAAKAAIYTHGAIEEFLRGRAELMRYEGAAVPVLIAVPPTAFGGRLIAMRSVANQRYVLLDRFEPRAVLSTIESQRIQALPLLPTMAEQLVASCREKSYDCSSLQVVNISGAHVSAAIVARLKASLGQARGVQQRPGGGLHVAVHYGMTETGGGIASSETGGAAGDGNVGRVIAGVEVRILDPDAADVAPGGVGEIVVRTPYAACGYWNDPERSAVVFRNGYVHTGDLGRLSDDGELCLLGRLKDVIVQGACKVLPTEVAHVIAGIPGVTECAVIGIPDELLGEEVVACVVCAPELPLAEQTVLRRCWDNLDPRKAPGQVFLFDSLPKTSAGKPDLHSLKGSVLQRRESARASRRTTVAAVRPQERRAFIRETVVVALRESLPGPGPAPLTMNDTTAFGDLGLDSLGSVRLAHRLGDLLAVPLSATFLYAYPSIAELCPQIESLLWGRPPATQKTAATERMRLASQPDPLALVGLGCRLPGAETPTELWRMLENGWDAIATAPVRRYTDGAGDWQACFVRDAGRFDAAFFGLEAHAARIDPRHRMLLEVTWEALEDAGQDPLRLPSDRTGVFIGISGERYRTPDPLGSSPGMAIGYLCQFFDLRGPALSIDTTCSSSLVAVHSAVNSLRSGECDVAIVAGASLLVRRGEDVGLGVVSPDGRSRAFAAGANGFGQGEGCVVLVLKRLAAARIDRDRIYAMVLGSAINHDGRSMTLTAPNPRSQAAVIRSALRNADMAPDAVEYIEAHGTGTPLGDPIEVEALCEAFGDHAGRSLPIGSIKTNIGHLEAAAGVAGLAKVALSIARARLVPSLGYAAPNPRIPWQRIPIEVQTQCTPWAREPRIAGVSSFGMSGTNAHVVVGQASWELLEAETNIRQPEDGSSVWILPLSARSSRSVQASAARFADALEGELGAATCREIAYTAACRRPHFEQRVAVTGRSHSDWIRGLREIAKTSELIARAAPNPRLAMVFGGQGSQWPGMGRELFDGEPVFRDAILRCSALFEEHLSWQLLAELREGAQTSRLGSTEVAQPALFAFQVALVELWKSWGVTPAAVVGHSVGEITAAWVAGALSLQQCARLVCQRGRVMQASSHSGSMLHVALSCEEAEALCREYAGGLEVAAVNSPQATTLSGATQKIEDLRARLDRDGVGSRLLPVDRAFHSRHMEMAAVQLSAALGDWTTAEPQIPLMSTVTGGVAPRMDARYWGTQIRAPVRFADATRTLLEAGHNVLLEVGPQPVLRAAMQQTIARFEYHEARVVGRSRRGPGEREALACELGELYCAGVAIDWARSLGPGGRLVDLPTYAWDHEDYWYDQRSDTTVDGSARSEVAAAADLGFQAGQEGQREYLRRLLALYAHLPVERVRSDLCLRDLGIDSLDTLRIRSRVERELGIDIPVSEFGSHLTLTQLSALCGRSSGRYGDRSRQYTRYLPVKRHGIEPHHVWIHPIGGGVDCYGPVVDRLPFAAAAIEMIEPLEPDSGPESVQRMASRYVRLLQANGARAPLVLGGWSFGGLVAYEMAAQLRHEGFAVPLVVLVDSYLPGGNGTGTLIKPNDPDGLAPVDARRLAAIRESNLTAVRDYRPSRYGGRVLLVKASQTTADCEAGWCEVVRSLEIEAVLGNHYSIVQPPALESVCACILKAVTAAVGELPSGGMPTPRPKGNGSRRAPGQ